MGDNLQDRNFTLRDEANAIVAWAFRNGPLEDLHAGQHSALLEDSNLSRISDDEMKSLMINACQQMAKILELKEADPAEYARKIKLMHANYCQGWER